MKAIKILIKHNACLPALEWVEDKSIQEAWESCQRGDWMLWIAAKLKVDEKKIFLAKALCAHQVIHLMTDQRSRNAVRAAFLYGRGKISKQKLNAAYAAADAYAAAAYAAYAAANAAANAAADDAAAYAAADAYAAAANAAADDAADAAYAAYAAADAYAAAANAAARQESLLKSATICRKLLTDEIYKKLGL